MSQSGLTLNNIKRTSPKLNPERRIRIADVTTPEERALMRKRRAENSARKRKFDDVDALMAEIITRFGWDAYKAFNAGEIEPEKMMRFLAAERAREASGKLNLYGIIMHMLGATIRRNKGEPAPKGPRVATKIFNEELKRAKGE